MRHKSQVRRALHPAPRLAAHWPPRPPARTLNRRPAGPIPRESPDDIFRSEPMTTETREFQTETRQVLRLVIHSLYSHKEIFLRELISNASDACEKLRFEALARPELLGNETLGVELIPDAGAGTLTIKDNGIGMSREEVIDN